MKTKCTIEHLRKFSAAYGKRMPRAICTCGHTGDGLQSSHAAGALGLAEGHGHCQVVGCGCGRFTWTRWTPAFSAATEAFEDARR